MRQNTQHRPAATSAKALLLCGSLVAAAAALATPIEHEVDTTGIIGPVRLAYGDHTANAALANPLEVDRYTFAGIAGDSTRLLLRTLSGGLDPSLVLRDPVGGIVASATCNGNDVFGNPVRCSTSLDWTLTSSGLYTVNMSDVGANEAGAYQLQLETYPPLNNWLGFGYGVSAEVAESLAVPVDMDFYGFAAAAGTQVRLTVVTTTGGLDPVLEIWSPSGQRLSETVCNGNDVFGNPIFCTNLVDLNIATSGVYKVGLRDSGLDDTGGYRLQANCLFGDCPTAIPSPIPEPASMVYLLLGAPRLALRLRRRSAGPVTIR